MPWVPDGQIPEETTICPQGVIRPGPHLPPQLNRSPRPPVPAPWAPLREEVGQQIFFPVILSVYSPAFASGSIFETSAVAL